MEMLQTLRTPELKAILFDNDGVLVDTERVYIQASVEAAAEGGWAITADDYVRLSMDRGISVFSELGLSADAQDALRAKRNSRYRDLLIGRDHTLPGVRETIEKLSRRVRLAVVTSSLKVHFDLIHAESGLLRYFEFVLTREDFVKSKPDPEPYRRGLERIGLPADACLVVEDSPRGVVSAADAGMRCIAIPTDLTRDGDFSRAFKVVKKIEDVVTVLEDVGKG